MCATTIRQDEGPFFKPPREFKRRGVNGFPIGKRTEKRAKENRKLGKLGIQHCEIRMPGICAGRRFLSWAHSQKARYLLTDKDWQEAARCCIPCHDTIEKMSHAEMKRIIREAIARRQGAWEGYGG